MWMCGVLMSVGLKFILLCTSWVIGVASVQPFKINDLTSEELAKNTDKEHDLLQAIKIPFTDTNSMYFDQGLDGFPAFGIFSTSDIKDPYRLHLPSRLYPEFAITCTVAVKSKSGGFVFAVLNPTETVVQLGVHLLPTDQNKLNISLFYTDVARFASSQPIASFMLEPYTIGKFVRFVLQVTADAVNLIYNCEKRAAHAVKRMPEELTFDPASTLYLGQGGPLMKGNLDVSNVLTCILCQ